MQKLGLQFPMMSNPVWFVDDPTFAWGFWGHRYHLYKNVVPHSGFEVLKRLADSKKNTGGFFIFTSNVDGAYQKFGFPEERIHECHGSVHWLQCSTGCTDAIWSSGDLQVQVDESTFRAAEPLPSCPKCGALARPNVLMFGDYEFLGNRTYAQENTNTEWVTNLVENNKKLAIIECGAGEAVPTVRKFGERCAKYSEGKLIRINLRDYQVPGGGIAIPLGAKDALHRIEKTICEL